MRQLLVAGLVSALLLPASARAAEGETHDTTLTFNLLRLVYAKALEMDLEHELVDRFSVAGTFGVGLPDMHIPVTLGAQALYRVWGDSFDTGLRLGLDTAVVINGPPEGTLRTVDAQGGHLWALASAKFTAKFNIVAKIDAGPELVANGPRGTVLFKSFVARLHIGWNF